MRGRILRFGSAGLYLQRRWRRGLTLSYSDILSAERLPSGWGLRLHTKSSEPVRIGIRGARRLVLEGELRQRGIRIVDEYGAMITPTFQDFETELAHAPIRLRQSSDSG